MLGQHLHAQLRPFATVLRLQAVKDGAIDLEPAVGVLALEPRVVARPGAQLFEGSTGHERHVGREEGRKGRGVIHLFGIRYLEVAVSCRRLACTGCCAGAGARRVTVVEQRHLQGMESRGESRRMLLLTRQALFIA
ncbi:hypothetical protein D3C84_892640 [compost metagenome]